METTTYGSSHSSHSYYQTKYSVNFQGNQFLQNYKNNGYKIFRSRKSFGNTGTCSASYGSIQIGFWIPSQYGSSWGSFSTLGPIVSYDSYLSAVNSGKVIYYYRVEKDLSNGMKDIQYFCGSSGQIENSSVSFIPTYRELSEPEYHSVSESEANALLE